MEPTNQMDRSASGNFSNSQRLKSDEPPPQNGLAGLRHWRQDIMAAFVVALVSVPLSLGIAVASKAPPICGLTSEIIAGLIFPLLGGAYVTVSGPAAGLAPILATQITALGNGDLDRGYHMVLVVIMLVGVVELLLTWMKAAKFSLLFPMSAIHGMLASIGFMLFSKQIPNLVGSPFHAERFFAVIAETPSELVNHVQPNVFSIGIICLLLLFWLSSQQSRGGIFRYVPPQIVAVIVGVLLARLYHLEGKFLVSIPSNLTEHGFVFPDFQAVFAGLALLPQIVLFVLTLTFVDGTESLATIYAVDRIDPFHRRSSPDRTLFAMGISNICSSLIGGLTIIPGIIKSTTNIVSGGRTAWVNFYNAIFLILFLVAASDLIRMIPLAALSAVLMHIGYKLAGLHRWRAMAKLGTGQLLIFTITVIGTLAYNDLLVGIAAGMIVKAAVLVFYFIKASDQAAFAGKIKESIALLFKQPLQRTEMVGDEFHVYFTGALTCFNCLKMRGVLESVADNVNKIVLHFENSVKLIDHSTNAYLFSLQDDWRRLGKEFEMDGFNQLHICAKDRASLRYRRASKTHVA